ncbi:hypothetical protein [uncultured Oscillibacter sp.]|jgi:cell division protein FtsB|uniref:hypothetical protein n=1 Tax=uncultured Oscillibacter sp. TaxID=876091 RepID=UPI002670282A|nr:hypothetical protein [uncultured Oscillibacter sp.]
MVKRREDSIRELNKRKTNEQLAAENAALREKVATLEGQLTDTQMALCDVYEALVGGEQ